MKEYNISGYTLSEKEGKPYYPGYLYLSGTSITSLPEGLTVGGSLDLSGTSITSLPEGLTVGGYLEGDMLIKEVKVCRELTADQRKRISEFKNKPIFWNWNGKVYLKVDGEFTQIDNQRGNVFHAHYLNGESVVLVTDGENHWAHGGTLAQAKADLIFKINDRDTSLYEKLSLDDELTFEEAIAAYRTITGACSIGTRNYIENRLPQPKKEKYSIREIITLTEGEYGSETFKKFFSK